MKYEKYIISTISNSDYIRECLVKLNNDLEHTFEFQANITEKYKNNNSIEFSFQVPNLPDESYTRIEIFLDKYIQNIRNILDNNR